MQETGSHRATESDRPLAGTGRRPTAETPDASVSTHKLQRENTDASAGKIDLNSPNFRQQRHHRFHPGYIGSVPRQNSPSAPSGRCAPRKNSPSKPPIRHAPRQNSPSTATGGCPPRKNSPSKPPIRHAPRQNSPCTAKFGRFGLFSERWAKNIALSTQALEAGRILSRRPPLTSHAAHTPRYKTLRAHSV